jgi:hypothetical protein
MKIRPFILALAGALGILAFSAGSPATPVFAASALASHGATPPSQTITQAQLLAIMAAAPSYTSAQLAGAQAYLLSHPFQGTIEVTSSSQVNKTGFQPYISIGWYWWGVRIHLTNGDVTSLFSAMVTYGTAAVAAALCAPSVWLAVVCGAVGAFVGWLVVQVVLQATNNFGGCGLNIDLNWWGNSNWYCA